QARHHLRRDGRLLLQRRQRPSAHPRLQRHHSPLRGHRTHQAHLPLPGPRLPADRCARKCGKRTAGVVRYSTMLALVRVHPQPLMFFLIVIAIAVVLPLAVGRWRFGLWQVARRHTRLTAFIILLAATLGVLDLYLGWRWRQTVPTLSKDL